MIALPQTTFNRLLVCLEEALLEYVPPKKRRAVEDLLLELMEEGEPLPLIGEGD